MASQNLHIPERGYCRWCKWIKSLTLHHKAAMMGFGQGGGLDQHTQPGPTSSFVPRQEDQTMEDIFQRDQALARQEWLNWVNDPANRGQQSFNHQLRAEAIRQKYKRQREPHIPRPRRAGRKSRGGQSDSPHPLSRIYREMQHRVEGQSDVNSEQYDTAGEASDQDYTNKDITDMFRDKVRERQFPKRQGATARETSGSDYTNRDITDMFHQYVQGRNAARDPGDASGSGYSNKEITDMFHKSVQGRNASRDPGGASGSGYSNKDITDMFHKSVRQRAFPKQQDDGAQDTSGSGYSNKDITDMFHRNVASRQNASNNSTGGTGEVRLHSEEDGQVQHSQKYAPKKLVDPKKMTCEDGSTTSASEEAFCKECDHILQPK